jgi:hypothetical protein
MLLCPALREQYRIKRAVRNIGFSGRHEILPEPGVLILFMWIKINVARYFLVGTIK